MNELNNKMIEDVVLGEVELVEDLGNTLSILREITSIT